MIFILLLAYRSFYYSNIIFLIFYIAMFLTILLGFYRVLDLKLKWRLAYKELFKQLDINKNSSSD